MNIPMKTILVDAVDGFVIETENGFRFLKKCTTCLKLFQTEK